MNNQRNDELRNLTMKVLARLNAPRAVAGDSEAMKAEAEFLVKRIIGLAPGKGYTVWFKDFEEQLLGSLETRSWPTAKQISQAAKDIAPKRPELRDLTGDNKYTPDPLKINARRIQRGEAVDENYINGKFADQMLRAGLIQEHDLQPYKEYLSNVKIG